MKCTCELACEDGHTVQWVQPRVAKNRVVPRCLLCGARKQEHLCVGAALILWSIMKDKSTQGRAYVS